MERTVHEGIPRTLLSTARDFFAWGFLWLIAVLLFSLPAAVVLLIAFPNAIGYFLLGVVTVSIMLVGKMFDRPNNSDDGPNVDPSSLTRNEVILNIAVMYAVFSALVSSILLVGSVAAGVVGFGTDFSLIAIAIAVLFPIIDAKTADAVPQLSIGRIGMRIVVLLINAIIRVYGVHTDAVDETNRQGRCIY